MLLDTQELPFRPFSPVGTVFCFLACAAAAVCARDVFLLFGFGSHLVVITVVVLSRPENGSATCNNLVDIHFCGVLEGKKS